MALLLMRYWAASAVPEAAEAGRAGIHPHCTHTVCTPTALTLYASPLHSYCMHPHCTHTACTPTAVTLCALSLYSHCMHPHCALTLRPYTAPLHCTLILHPHTAPLHYALTLHPPLHCTPTLHPHTVLLLHSYTVLIWLDWATTRFRFYQPAARTTGSYCVLGPVLSSPAHASSYLAMPHI
jgi:hypothetical protein